MLKNIRKLLNIESLQEKIEDIKSIEKNIKASDSDLDALSTEYVKEIDLYKSRDSYGSLEAKSRIEKNFGEFMVDYTNRLSKSIFYKKSLEKDRDKLLKDSRLSDIIVSIEKDKHDYDNLKKACKDGILPSNKFIDILKSKQGGKVKYSDNIVFNEDGKILILKRSRWEDKFQGAWVIPGGHVDPGEEFKEAGIRELQEESGYNVNDAELSGIFEDDNCIINYFTSHINTKEQPMILDYKETIDYRWIYPDEVDDYQMVFSMAENIKKILGIIPNFVMNIEKSKDTDKIATVMREFKSGTLTSSGKKVTDRKQAIAIAMSESGMFKSDNELDFKQENEKKSDFIKKFREFLLNKGKIDEYNLKSIKYYPKGLDLENRDLIYIDEDKAIYCIGRDLQIPKYITFGLIKENSGIELQVIEFSSEDPLKNIDKKINVKKEKIRLGFIDDIEKSFKDEINSKFIKKQHSQEYGSKYLSKMIDKIKKIMDIIEPYSKTDSKIADEVCRLKNELVRLKKEKFELLPIEKAFNDGFLDKDQLERVSKGVYKNNQKIGGPNIVGKKHGLEEKQKVFVKSKQNDEESKEQHFSKLESQSKKASSEALERASKDAKDAEVRVIAKQELGKREEKEKTKKEDVKKSEIGSKFEETNKEEEDGEGQ